MDAIIVRLVMTEGKQTLVIPKTIGGGAVLSAKLRQKPDEVKRRVNGIRARIEVPDDPAVHPVSESWPPLRAGLLPYCLFQK